MARGFFGRGKVEIVGVDYEDEEGLVDVLRRRRVEIVSFELSFGGVWRFGGSVRLRVLLSWIQGAKLRENTDDVRIRILLPKTAHGVIFNFAFSEPRSKQE